jgi:hypothetical protein
MKRANSLFMFLTIFLPNGRQELHTCRLRGERNGIARLKGRKETKYGKYENPRTETGGE